MGFETEGLMKNYGPDGSDYIRYARIIKWVFLVIY
jgi:hypothetical protein